MAGFDELSEEVLGDIRKGWEKIKVLAEEKKSISEDIAEEKKEISKKCGIAVKDLNAIFTVVLAKEKGEWSDEDVLIADKIAARVTLSPPTKLNE